MSIDNQSRVHIEFAEMEAEIAALRRQNTVLAEQVKALTEVYKGQQDLAALRTTATPTGPVEMTNLRDIGLVDVVKEN